MNVFIFPTDDRSGQASLIHHYSSRGHRVFLPKFGTLGLNWSRIATWPMLLYKNSLDPQKRNIDIHGFVRSDIMFGEDFFLNEEIKYPLYDGDISCELIDLETEKHEIDVFHTLRGAEAYLSLYFDIAKKHFPNAKWVSSTFNQMTSTPGNFVPKNAAKLIPAPYENHHSDINNVCLMSTDFERKILGVKLHTKPRMWFASFNHNFANRQPEDFRLFEQMNALLEEKIPNFGGNIRTQGADIRYSGDQGITGKFETLTPPVAYALTSTLRAIIHFKETDWGGGVFYYALNTGTPIITTEKYVKASNSSKYIVPGHNAEIVTSPQGAANAVNKLLHDDAYVLKLVSGMKEMKDSVFSDEYWENWDRFLARLT